MCYEELASWLAPTRSNPLVDLALRPSIWQMQYRRGDDVHANKGEETSRAKEREGLGEGEQSKSNTGGY